MEETHWISRNEKADNLTQFARSIVPIAKFLPLISEIENIFDMVIDIAHAAEHNKRICNSLKQRIYAVNLAVLDLKVQRYENQEFFRVRNFFWLQNLVEVINQMKLFMKNISQINTLLKLNWIKPTIIEKFSRNYVKILITVLSI